MKSSGAAIDERRKVLLRRVLNTMRFRMTIELVEHARLVGRNFAVHKLPKIT